MITCHYCGSENDIRDAYCYSCGNALRPPQQGDTHMLKSGGEFPASKRRWGTARFDEATTLYLYVRDYDNARIPISLMDELLVGRAFDSFTPDLDLTEFDAFDRGVSRQHAILRRQNNTVVLIDLNSANSTYLNGKKLVPEQPRIVRDGDEIRLGQLVLRVSFED